MEKTLDGWGLALMALAGREIGGHQSVEILITSYQPKVCFLVEVHKKVAVLPGISKLLPCVSMASLWRSRLHRLSEIWIFSRFFSSYLREKPANKYPKTIKNWREQPKFSSKSDFSHIFSPGFNLTRWTGWALHCAAHLPAFQSAVVEEPPWRGVVSVTYFWERRTRSPESFEKKTIQNWLVDILVEVWVPTLVALHVEWCWKLEPQLWVFKPA